MPRASRYKFFDNIWNDEFEHVAKGLSSQNLYEIFSNDDDIIYTIKQEEEFRPDNIARKFYGNAKLYWILVYVNNINNSPEGFYVERNIRVPRYERVIDLI